MSARLRRLVGKLVLVAFVGILSSPLVASSHLQWSEEAECGSPALGPRHARTQFESAGTPQAASHCAICHWARAVAGSAPTASASGLPGLAPRGLHVEALVWWSGQSRSFERPSRAPPVSLTL
jgi:hypothetical protein